MFAKQEPAGDDLQKELADEDSREYRVDPPQYRLERASGWWRWRTENHAHHVDDDQQQQRALRVLIVHQRVNVFPQRTLGAE